MPKTRAVLVTGSAGVDRLETVRRFASEGLRVIGIDNDLRRQFLATKLQRPTRDALREEWPEYEHHDLDIRRSARDTEIFREHGQNLIAIVHTAAQAFA